jgi:hypothetical protein
MSADPNTVTVSAQRPYMPARQPRGVVKLNGQAVPWVSFEVTNNSFYEADTFRVTFAIGALQPQNAQFVYPEGPSWFATQKTIFVEIFAGFPMNPNSVQAGIPTPSSTLISTPTKSGLGELASLIYGRVDSVEYRLEANEITVTGRDLSSLLIDDRVAEEFVNQCASNIAIITAQNYGLMPVVTDTQELGFAGTYDDAAGVVTLQMNGSAWDLLAKLARQVGFVVYVRGQSLYFQPDPTEPDNPSTIWWKPSEGEGPPHSNAISIELTRAMTLARGITVTVRAPSFNNTTPIIASYPTASKGIAAGKATPFGGVQPYDFIRPAGTTPAQAGQYAEQMYKTIMSHALKLRARLPGDSGISIVRPIKLTGTGTPFDGTYYPRSITREMSIHEGYSMEVEAWTVPPVVSATQSA